MIRVKKIVIVEFRGIRNLTIDFNQKNFAICGKNGTGKSGVVDALEFALTGNISRLSGSGTGDISLKEHAPHVDSRNNPEKAHVTLTVFIPSLNKEVTIDRNVKESNSPTITPNNLDIKQILDEVATHPEFTLSRRELIKYVISAPGERAKEVQALLRLDKVEDIRTVLQKVMNSLKKEALLQKKEKDGSQQLLLSALQITDLNNLRLLEAVNVQRSILGLPSITALTNKTSFKDGLLTTPIGTNLIHINKIQALADIKKLYEIIIDIGSSETMKLISSIKDKLAELATDPTVNDAVTREHFLKSAIELINDEKCPVCDTQWNLDELKEIITSKLKHFDFITVTRIKLEKELEPLTNYLNNLFYSLKTIEGYANLLKPSIDTNAVKIFKTKIQSDSEKLESFLPLSETIAILDSYGAIPSSVNEVIATIENAIISIPDATKQDAARDYLTVGQERLDSYRSISLRHKQAEEKAKLTTEIFDTYAKVSTEVLNTIYKEVQRDFTDLYRFINNDDEKNFEAELTPSIGKLSFDVDFYGKGFFPPGAYHSEGHQDGMGLCLYLALMKHLLGNSFTFAVLDDVLMSVDSGHRREVCKLLNDKFPDTQFILTTHDKIWLKYMKTSGLIQPESSVFFRNWDVENGPSEWKDRDIWTEIEEELKNDRVNVAAGLLRNYLEFISSEICHNLRANVEYRGDGHFDLGDLLPKATSALNKLLSTGEAAAISWGKTDEATSIKKHKEDFTEIVVKSQIEQWHTNSAIHYNEWENFQAKDFSPVVESYHKLIKSFFCSDTQCCSLLYVTPSKGQKEMLRCTCGTTSINLNKK